MYVYNGRENFRVNMERGVSFMELGSFNGRLVIIRAEEDGFPPKRTFKHSRDLFYIAPPEVDDEEAVKETANKSCNLALEPAFAFAV